MCRAVGPWGHIYECPPAPTTVAIRAGRLFDSLTGRMLTKQVILVQGQKIADVGPEGTLKIPAGTRVIDLSQATVLPGFIDTHTHVFNARSEANKLTADASMLLAVENVRGNLLAGFTTLRDMDTHGNGFQDVELKNAINRGAIDGPRMLVSGRGIAGGTPVPEDTLETIRVSTVDGRGRRRTRRAGSGCGAHQASTRRRVTNSISRACRSTRRCTSRRC